MGVIWTIDPALAGPPLSASVREKQRVELRARLDATLARIGQSIADDAALNAERRAALEWCRQNDNPHWEGAVENPFAAPALRQSA